MTDLSPSDWADLLDRSAASVAGLVESAPEGTDWTAPAPGLDWSLHQVVEHMADDVVFYASQLTRGKTDGWANFAVRIEGTQTPAALADVLVSLSGLLSAVVRQSPPDALGHHVFGVAGPRDMAAMGIVELLVHGEDIRRGLGAEWVPDDDVARAVLAHLFAEPDPGVDAWGALLDRCGRTGGDPDWRWRNTAT